MRYHSNSWKIFRQMKSIYTWMDMTIASNTLVVPTGKMITMNLILSVIIIVRIIRKSCVVLAVQSSTSPAVQVRRRGGVSIHKVQMIWSSSMTGKGSCRWKWPRRMRRSCSTMSMARVCMNGAWPNNFTPSCRRWWSARISFSCR